MPNYSYNRGSVDSTIPKSKSSDMPDDAESYNSVPVQAVSSKFQCQTCLAPSWSDERDDSDTVTISAYSVTWLQKLTTIALYLATGGIFYLILYWLPKLRFKFYLMNEALLNGSVSGTFYFIEKNHGEVRIVSKVDFFELSYLDPGNYPDSPHLVHSFIFNDLRLFWKPDTIHRSELSSYGKFVLAEPCLTQKLLLSTLNVKLTSKSVFPEKNEDGTPANQTLHRIRRTARDIRAEIYGTNTITVKVPSHIEAFIKEIMSAFYIFQVYSCLIWYLDYYEVYATSIVIMSGVSIAVTLYQIRVGKRMLQRMVDGYNRLPERRYNADSGIFEPALSCELVVGDIITLDHKVNQCLTADCILLSGNVILNEGMLTGESMPVIKTAAGSVKSGEYFSHEQHRQHVLYCGTEVLQCRQQRGEPCLGLVIRTGFWTDKGALVRSILYPKPCNLSFEQDSYRFIFRFAQLAVFGLLYSMGVLVWKGATLREIIMKPLDMITIVVPPALPAATAVGIIYAQQRLKKLHEIYCVSPTRINVSGQVNVTAFDKTGTLTEDGLRLQGTDSGHGELFRLAMASCHTLTILNGKMQGDPLDEEMFKAADFDLHEPDQKQDQTLEATIITDRKNASNSYGFQRQIPFSSAAQRMSVVIKHRTENASFIFVKGAPEKVIKLCKSKPEDFHKKLKEYTRRGLRVIAVAYKKNKMPWIKVQKADREIIEKNLNFIGFLLLENPLKFQSRPTIEKLQNADIRTVMITGDNLDTALAVGRQCNIVRSDWNVFVAETYQAGPSMCLKWNLASQASTPTDLHNLNPASVALACTGTDFQNIATYFPQWLDVLAARGCVLARMKPGHKSHYIQAMTDIGSTALMCGDGSNDCAALKRAHVGISLSDLEASVASPFTSKVTDITCVEKLVREGRCALVTSIGLFKYIALYSMIQFITILIMYYYTTNLGDWMYLYIDLVILDTIALTMSLNHANKVLTKEKPPQTLMDGRILVSVFLQVLVSFCFQFGFMYSFKNLQCYRHGYIVEGFESCACANIQNRTTMPHPDYPVGTRFYNNTVQHLDKTPVPENVTCLPEPSQRACYARYAYQKYDNFSSVPLPDPPAFEGASTFETAAEWLNHCAIWWPKHEEIEEQGEAIETFVYGVHTDQTRTFITTAMFFYSIFHYLGMALIYSTGPPFRSSVYKNVWFTGSLIVLVLFSIYLLILPPAGLIQRMDLTFVPQTTQFHTLLLIYGFGYIAVAWFLEATIAANTTFHHRIRKLLGIEWLITTVLSTKTEQKLYEVLAAKRSDETGQDRRFSPGTTPLTEGQETDALSPGAEERLNLIHDLCEVKTFGHSGDGISSGVYTCHMGDVDDESVDARRRGEDEQVIDFGRQSPPAYEKQETDGTGKSSDNNANFTGGNVVELDQFHGVGNDETSDAANTSPV